MVSIRCPLYTQQSDLACNRLQTKVSKKTTWIFFINWNKFYSLLKMKRDPRLTNT